MVDIAPRIRAQSDIFIEECACEYLTWDLGMWYSAAREKFSCRDSMETFLLLRIPAKLTWSENEVWCCPYGCHRIEI